MKVAPRDFVAKRDSSKLCERLSHEQRRLRLAEINRCGFTAHVVPLNVRRKGPAAGQPPLTDGLGGTVLGEELNIAAPLNIVGEPGHKIDHLAAFVAVGGVDNEERV